MSEITVSNNIVCQTGNQPRSPAVHGNPVPEEQNVQNEQEDAFEENQKAAPKKKENGFNIFSFSWGLVKGFVKEAFNILLFVPKLAFNLITNPVETIKPTFRKSQYESNRFFHTDAPEGLKYACDSL